MYDISPPVCPTRGLWINRVADAHAWGDLFHRWSFDMTAFNSTLIRTKWQGHKVQIPVEPYCRVFLPEGKGNWILWVQPKPVVITAIIKHCRIASPDDGIYFKIYIERQWPAMHTHRLKPVVNAYYRQSQLSIKLAEIDIRSLPVQLPRWLWHPPERPHVTGQAAYTFKGGYSSKPFSEP